MIKASVIIPVYNNPDGLKRLLASLVGQDFPEDQYEVIVADNRSTDSSQDIAQVYTRNYPRLVKNVSEDKIQSSYAARNRGIQIAQGEILAFTDSDCVPCESWLTEGCKALWKDNASMIAGKIEFTFKKSQPNFWEYFDAAGKLNQKSYVESAGFGATANLFVRKDIFKRYGMFLSELESGGDYEFGRRLTQAGEKLNYCERVIVFHPARSTFKSKLKKSRRVAKGQRQLAEMGLLKHGILTWRSLIPSFQRPSIEGIPLIFPEGLVLIFVSNLFRYYNFINRFHILSWVKGIMYLYFLDRLPVRFIIALIVGIKANFKGYESFLTNDKIDYDYEGDISGISLIFSTSKGICILDTEHNVARMIMKGHSYGITKVEDTWLVQRTLNRRSKVPKRRRVSSILSLKIKNYSVGKIRSVIIGFPSEIHQIDCAKNTLFIPFTGYPKVLLYQVKNLKNNTFPRTFFSSKSYNFSDLRPKHLNSIFWKDETLYVIAHNLSAHTGKQSQVIVHDVKTRSTKIKNLNARDAHNVHADSTGKLMYCNSTEGKLIRNDKVIFETNKVLRGLSLTQEKIFVGGSNICFEEDKRLFSEATIYVLNHSGAPVGRIDFPDLGNIYEIRQFSGTDYALSGSSQL